MSPIAALGPGRPRPPLVPGDGERERALDELAMSSLVKACIAVGHCKLNPRTDPRSFAASRWGTEAANNAEAVIKAASAPAMTSTPGWAKEFSRVVWAFLRNLTPLSAGADLLDKVLRLNFDGAGAISIPNLSVPLADFVGQGAPIPVVDGTVNIQATLEPHKFGVITVLTNEMLTSSNAEALMRDALLQSTGPALDRRLFDANAAVADVRPAGLLYGITPLGATAGGGYAAMVGDLGKLANAVAPKSGNGGMTLIAAAPQAIAISLQLVQGSPWPLLTSTSLPAGTIIGVANAGVVVAAGAAPTIDTTAAASLVMDTAPGAIMTGGSVRANFQTDTTGLRLRWPISWAVRDPGAIAVIQNTTW
jgi:hypothetical protein